MWKCVKGKLVSQNIISLRECIMHVSGNPAGRNLSGQLTMGQTKNPIDIQGEGT